MRLVEGTTFAVRDPSPDGRKTEIHALTTRLDAGRRNPPPGMSFYR